MDKLNFRGLPGPIKDMLTNLDPATIEMLLNSLDKEQLEPLLTGLMEYIQKLPEEKKEDFLELLKPFLQNQ